MITTENSAAKQEVKNNSIEQELPVDDEVGVAEAVNETCQWQRKTQLRRKVVTSFTTQKTKNNNNNHNYVHEPRK